MKLINQSNTAIVIEFSDKISILFSYSVPVAAKVGNYWYKTEEGRSVSTSLHINTFISSHKNVLIKTQRFFDNFEKNIGL